MRILLVHNFYRYWGGEDTYFKSLKELLEEKGHKVITYSKNSSEIKTIFDKIKVIMGLFWNFKIEKELIKIIKSEKPEITQFQNIFPLISPAAYKILHKHKIPVIQRISNYGLIKINNYHNSAIAGKIFAAGLFWHRVLGNFRLIDIYVFPSEIIKKDFINYYKIAKSRTIVVPTFSNEWNSKVTTNKKREYFLYVGRLSAEKGTIQLIDIFSKLVEIKIIIVGSGPIEKELHNKYGQFDNIIMKGHLNKEQLQKYYKGAIATIVPSLGKDVFPTVILESNFNETPVIAPSKDSFVNMVNHNITGLLYKTDDHESLKNKIMYAYTNKKKMLQMGKQAKKNYISKYSKKIIYNELINLYNDLLIKK